MPMQKKLLSAIVVAVLAVQAAAASEHHGRRAKSGPVVSEQLRNSNAYAAPADISVPSDAPDYAEGAMTSGIAGH